MRCSYRCRAPDAAASIEEPAETVPVRDPRTLDTNWLSTFLMMLLGLRTYSRCNGKERTADAHATTACALAVLERRDVFEFLERQPDAWPSIVEVLCDRLRATDRQMAEVAMQQLPVRLAKVLLRMTYVEALSRPADRVKVSQRELGNIVGAARESVNKCLSQWQRSGGVHIGKEARKRLFTLTPAVTLWK